MTWETKPLGSVVEVLDGKRIPVKASDRAARQGDVPYYGATGQAGWIDEPIFNEPLVLLGEDGAPFFDPYKPKAYFVDGPAWVNNHAHVLRATGVDRRYLKYYLDQFNYEDFANGTTRLKLTQGAMKRIPLRFPKQEEQRRIVELVEEHLSHLDAADAALAAALSRSADLHRSRLWMLTHSTGGAISSTSLDRVATVRLGRQRSPKNHAGDRMRPYLRAANVDWDQFRLDDIKEMQFTAEEEETYALRAGDILLTEASGSPREVGKSAICTASEAGLCFQNTLLLVRCHDADPQFVQKYLLAEAMTGRFMPAARGVGINHLGRARLAKLEITLPGRNDQAKIAAQCADMANEAANLERALESQKVRSHALRRAVLAAAFSGRLTGSSSDTETIEETAAALPSPVQETLL